MVPLSGAALRHVFRLFDVNVALGMTTAARRVAQWPCSMMDVRWHRMGLGSNLKNPSTSRDAELA